MALDGRHAAASLKLAGSLCEEELGGSWLAISSM